MPFPFSIKYSATFKEKIPPDDYPEIFNYIEKFIVVKPAKDIIIEGNTLSFKPGSSAWNWNIMRPIEKGIFTLVSKENELVLTYEFFMYRLFIITSVMAVFLSIASQSLWIGIGCFSWLGGMNWLTALTRHKSMFDELEDEIKSLMEKKKQSSPISPP